MRALVVRELRQVLWTPAGVGLVAVWLFLVGSLFMVELVAFEQAEQRALALNDPAMLSLLDVNDVLIASVMNNLTVVLLFLGPLLALRQWSDGAARQWLLQRSPSTMHFVVARAVAAGITVTIMVALTLVFAGFLAMVGRPAVGDVGVVVDPGQTLLSCATVIMAGFAFVVVSGVATVAVDQPLAGALLAFVLLLVSWLLPSATAMVGPTFAPTLGALSPATHIEAGLRGVLDVGDVLWWLGVVTASLLATAGVVEWRRR